jgi:hypothetical protein
VQFAPVHWPDDAEKLDFSAGPRGKRVRNGTELRSEGSWFALALRKPSAVDPSRRLLGAPGLWRGLRERPLQAERRWSLQFDLPPLASPEVADETCAEHPCAALIRWAEATVDGSPPSGWEPPLGAEVEDWIPSARRRVRAGADVAQVDLVVEPGRFALVIAALVRVPDEMPPARSAWLDEICRDTQERWRMVRFGIDEAASSVRAEVDLTGAPTDRAQPLAELALAALTCATEWALPTLSLVTDTAIASRILDEEPRWASSHLNKGGTKR